MNMKTTNRNPFVITIICVLALSFGVAAYAEKGAERLVNLSKAPATPTQTAVAESHKCASCTDALVTVIDKGTKGPNFASSKVARHNCNACETKVLTAGTGKAKHDVAVHSCNAVVKPACCAKN